MKFSSIHIIFFLLISIRIVCHGQAFEIEGDVMINGLQTDSVSESFLVLKEDNTIGIKEFTAPVEYQFLQMSGDTIFLSNGGFVVLPPDQVDDADADPNNEIQNLSSNEDTLFISNSNYIVLPGLQYLSSLIPEVPIQERLDSGETPIELYQIGIPLDSLYGKIYEGGYIFFVDVNDDLPSIEGMVASLNDISFFNTYFWSWGCSSADPLTPVTSFPPSGPTAEVGDGWTNTDTIVAHICSASNYAAEKCYDANLDDYTDWFLPSAKELLLMWEHLADSDGDNSNSGPSDPGNLGNFESVDYWSSTLGDDAGAWKTSFSDGTQEVQLRSNAIRVRAVRLF